MITKWILIILGILVAIAVSVLLVGLIIYLVIRTAIEIIELSDDLQDTIKRMKHARGRGSDD